MQRLPLRLSFLLVLLTLLAACGFQLRGTGGAELPEEWRLLYLDTNNPNGELSRELRSVFAAHDITWVEQEQANFSIAIGAERFRQRNLSINAEARASEFELTMSTSFNVRGSEGEMVIPPSEASVVKQMENDPSNVVGKAEEVRMLQAEMRSELVQQILRRVGFFATTNPAAPAEPATPPATTTTTTTAPTTPPATAPVN